jgi:glycosyltransferase involved in cell wall biosynthesis
VRKLGEAGREHVRKSFSWGVAAEKFDSYIKGLSQSASPQEVETHA